MILLRTVVLLVILKDTNFVKTHLSYNYEPSHHSNRSNLYFMTLVYL